MDGGTLKEFANKVSQYFLDFLESDFKRQQAPRRRVVYERLVLVEGAGQAKDLAGPEQMDFPSVLYRAPPGRAYDFHSKRYVPIAHDSTVYERWNSITKTFYLTGKNIQMVQSSD